MIQRNDALRQSAIDALPFRARKDPRNQIEGEEPLGAAAVAVNGKRDALNEKRNISQAPPRLKMDRRHRDELLENLGIWGTRMAGRRKHLVVEPPRVITLKYALAQVIHRA